jgi:oxalate decarboxylase/phosphoglucose isomerase-like protein (cupin superfamily)
MADCTLIKAEEGEVIQVGPLKIRIQETGRNTDNRIGSVSIIVPARSKGPPIHWHRMHDETFLVTRGTVRFSVITTTKEHADLDAKTGDYVVVPPKAVHTFSNPFDEEAEMFNTFTPAYYVDYLKMVAKVTQSGQPIGAKEARAIMAQFATFPPEVDGEYE